MFFEPNETQFDLRWRMLGTDVRVSPWFWLFTVLLGWSAVREGVSYLVVWVVCVFVSILVHEFGHVLMGRVFGSEGHIILYSFGGLAVGSSALENRWKRIAVYLAGPGAGFVLFGLVLAFSLFVRPTLEADEPRPLLHAAINDLVFINLGWGILNLLPIYPLDGGQVSRDFCDWVFPGGTGLRAAFGLSMVVAGILALLAVVWLKSLYMALMFGMLAFGSFQLMQTVSQQSRYEDDRLPWERDRDDDQRRW